MWRMWLRVAVFTCLLSASAWSDADVTVVMLNGQRVYGRLIQYVGGEFVVEETPGKRVSIDVRLVDQLLFGRPGKRRKTDLDRQVGPGLWRDGARPSDKQGAGSPPAGEQQGTPARDKGDEPGDPAGTLDSKFDRLAALGIEEPRDLGVARDLVMEISEQARKSNKTPDVLKRFGTMVEGAQPGTRDKVKWLAFASLAHREAGEHEKSRSLALRAREEASGGRVGGDVLRMLFPDRPGRRGGRRGKSPERP